MGLADRQMLNLAAMDALTRRYRERMAGALVANPVDAERLAEIQPEPQIPVAVAVEETVDAILEQQTGMMEP